MMAVNGVAAGSEVGEIFSLFGQTVNPNPLVREAAEKQLQLSSKRAGFGSLLLQAVTLSASDAGTRQSVAVFFKNYVEKHWDSQETAVSETDKQFIRANLIQALVAVGSVQAVRVQLLACVYKLMRYDGDRWLEVDDQALSLLQSSDAASVAVGLFVTLELVKARSIGGDRRLETTLSRLMASVLSIGEQALAALASSQAGSPVDELTMMVKTTAKIFFDAIRYKFSASLLGNGSSFAGWFRFLQGCLALPTPASELPSDSDETGLFDRRVFWKLRKWALRSLNRLAARYGRKDEAAGKEEKTFAKAFAAQAAVPALYAVLGLLTGALNTEAADANRAVSGAWALSETCTCLIVEQLTTAVRVKQTWNVIKAEGHMPTIIGAFVFPRLGISAGELEEWRDDPAAFLKSVFFTYDDYNSPRSACSTFISDAVKARSKHVLPMILQHLQSVFDAYASAPRPTNDHLARQKDAALVLLGSISTEFCAEKGLKEQVPALMQAHVLPDLLAAQAFLRLRASWCLEQFADIPMGVASIPAMIAGLLAGIKDQELPVRAQSAVTIGSLLDQEGMQAAIHPHLGAIVTTTLELTTAVELDALSYVMDRLVALFPNDLSPYAAELTVQLRDALLRLLENSLEADAEQPGNFYFNDTDKMMAALAQIDTIDTIVIQMCNTPEIALRCEAALLPLARLILERKLVDLMSEMASLLESITFRTKAISPDMWSMGDMMLQLLRSDMPEYLPDFAGVFENLISYGAGALLSNAERVSGLVEVIEKASHIDPEGYDSEADTMAALDLVETMMLYCRGGIDVLLSKFMDIALNGLAKVSREDPEERSTVCTVRYLELVLNALYYNPGLTVQFMNSHPASWSMVLELWSAAHEGFKRVHDKRLVIAGLSALFGEVQVSQLPPEVVASLPSLLALYVQTVQAYPKAVAERERLRKAEDEEANNAEEEYDADELISSRHYGEIVDDEDEDDNERAAAEDESGEQAAADEEDEDEDWADDDWEDSDELEEDLYFECPLDGVDFGSLVRGTLNGLPGRNPEMWARMSGALSAEQIAQLRSIA